MDQVWYFLLALLCLLIGGCGGFWFMRLRASADASMLGERLRGRDFQIADLESKLQAEKTSLEQLQTSNGSLQAMVAELNAKLEAANTTAREKVHALEDSHAKLMANFQALAADALKNNNQTFLDLASRPFPVFRKPPKEILMGGKAPLWKCCAQSANRWIR